MAGPGPIGTSTSDAPFVVRSGTRMSGRHAHSRSSSKPFVVQVANTRSPLLAGNSFASAHKRIVDVGPAAFANVGKKAALLALKWGGLAAMVTLMVLKINEQGVPRCEILPHYPIRRQAADAEADRRSAG